MTNGIRAASTDPRSIHRSWHRHLTRIRQTLGLTSEQLAQRAVPPSNLSLLGLILHTRVGKQINLRWAYVHMIEEYARHAGHADLLRERIDGSKGS
jgi:Protein of unknown function (DUF664)